jgi:hypothetical protein
LAKTSLRVPVVVYNGLSRKDESRLFIDINTKQRPVPNELLLDIKQLADYETDIEQQLREIYDLFNSDPYSPLLGLLSPSERVVGKVSRVTFNAAVKPLVNIFGGNESQEIYQALGAYLQAFITTTDSTIAKGSVTNPTVFRAIMLLFSDVAQRVQDRHGKSYTIEHFAEVLEPTIARLRASLLNKPGNSSRALYNELQKALRSNFTLF